MRPLARTLAALALIAACVLVVYWKIAFTAQYTFIEAPDIGPQVLPWLQVQFAAFQRGLWPLLWDPYIGGGQPLAGQLQPAVFSPLTWILLLTPPDAAGHLRLEAVHLWFVFIHVLAGWFAYAFLRSMAASRPASATGAVFFACAGFVGTTNWPQIIAAAIWLPLVFLYHLRAVAAVRAVRSAILAGVFFGLSLLAGHHAVPVFAALAIVGLAIAYAAKHRVSWAGAARSTAILFAVAACVAAPQLITAVDYGHHSLRWVNSANPMDWQSVVPYPVHENLGWDPASFIFLIVPGSSETIVNPIVGFIPVALAVIALLASDRRPAAAPLAGIALGAILFSLPRFNPFHGVLYALVPGLEKARAPVMAMAIADVALAGLAAVGMDALLSRAVPHLRRIAAWIASAAAFLFVLALYPPAVLQSVAHGPGRTAMVAIAGSLFALLLIGWQSRRFHPALLTGAILALSLIEIGNSTAFDYVHIEDKASIVRPRLYETTGELAAFLKSHVGSSRVSYDVGELLFNLGDWYGIPSLAGFLPSAPAAMYRLGPWNPRILDLYGVRYWIGTQKGPDGGQQVYADANGWKVWLRPTALPHEWLVHQVKVAGSQPEAIRLVNDASLDLRGTAIVEQAAQVEACTGDAALNVANPSEHHVRIDAAPACAALLVISDSWYPGWRATLDGRPVALLRADAALRAIAVPAGAHRVEMIYRPLL